jgi:hypothetical protein
VYDDLFEAGRAWGDRHRRGQSSARCPAAAKESTDAAAETMAQAARGPAADLQITLFGLSAAVFRASMSFSTWACLSAVTWL